MRLKSDTSVQGLKLLHEATEIKPATFMVYLITGLDYFLKAPANFAEERRPVPNQTAVYVKAPWP